VVLPNSPEVIKKVNNLSSDMVYPGQSLLIPKPKQANIIELTSEDMPLMESMQK
jgi:LysM repeat protein